MRFERKLYEGRNTTIPSGTTEQIFKSIRPSSSSMSVRPRLLYVHLRGIFVGPLEIVLAKILVFGTTWPQLNVVILERGIEGKRMDV